MRDRVLNLVTGPVRLCRGRVAGKTRGQALVMVGVMMMVLIGFAALVIDGGTAWYNRRLMQNAVDAAALAAAQNLPQTSGYWDASGYGVRWLANDYAVTRNGVTDMVVDSSPQPAAGSESCTANPNVDILICQTYGPSDTVRVTAHKTYRPIFGLVGFVDIPIRARATAVVGSIRSACVAPFFQTEDILRASGVWDSSGLALNRATIMKTSSGDGTSGNFLGLRLPEGSGAAVFRDAIGNPSRCLGETAPQTSGTASTEPGNMVGPLNQGMADRKAAWQAQGTCLSTAATTYLRPDGKLFNGDIELTPATCYRMIQIPLLAGAITDFSGATTAPVRGFLTFYISNWCGGSSDPRARSGICDPPTENPSLGQLQAGELWGYYVGFTAQGNEDFNAYDGFGTKIVALIG